MTSSPTLPPSSSQAPSQASSRPWRTGPLLVFLLLFTFVAAGLAEFEKASHLARTHLSLWEEELARTRLDRQADPQLAEKVMSQLKQLHPALSPQTSANEETPPCLLKDSVPLRLFAVPAGHVDLCFQLPALIGRGLLSPVVLLALLLVGSLVFLGARRDWRTRLQNERAEAELRLHRETSRLARQVAHDIRGPLTALRTLGRQGQTLHNAESLALLHQASDRIHHIAEDLLQKSIPPKSNDQPPRAEPSDFSLKAGSCCPAEVLDQMRSELECRFPDRELRFSVGEADRHARIPMSAQEFARILSNLVQNASEATEVGQQITLALRRHGDQLSFVVADEGRGFPVEVLANLGREPMSRGKSKGSGLGLHHARRSVEALGGSLRIQSRPLQGSLVELNFAASGGTSLQTESRRTDRD